MDLYQNQIKNLTLDLLSWFAQNARDLPWRQNKNAYHIWVSEIMLQQTRVEAVKGYYARFLTRYPDIPSLAKSDPEELSKYWEGLGYYSRMRNLHRCAKILCEQYGAKLPDTYGELLKLPGIGSYTAGAIASIAYGKRVPAVDGNVLRVLSRVLASDRPIDDPKVKRDVFALLQGCMPQDAGAFNQAFMDLGAAICLPNGAPICDACPIRAHCTAYAQNTQQSYPVKAPKRARKIQDITYLILLTPDGFLLHKRPDTGLLAAFWEYPNLPGALSESEVAALLQTRQITHTDICKLPDKKHIFTHIEWNITAYFAACKPFAPGENEIFAPDAQIKAEIAMPTAFDQYDRIKLMEMK